MPMCEGRSERHEGEVRKAGGRRVVNQSSLNGPFWGVTSKLALQWVKVCMSLSVIEAFQSAKPCLFVIQIAKHATWFLDARETNN